MPGTEDNLKQLSKSCNRGKKCQLNKKNTLAYSPMDHFSLSSVCCSDLASLSGSGAAPFLACNLCHNNPWFQSGLLKHAGRTLTQRCCLLASPGFPTATIQG